MVAEGTDTTVNLTAHRGESTLDDLDSETHPSAAAT
jgi:hypothetical protein